jgi:hypothetical protein
MQTKPQTWQLKIKEGFVFFYFYLFIFYFLQGAKMQEKYGWGRGSINLRCQHSSYSMWTGAVERDGIKCGPKVDQSASIVAWKSARKTKQNIYNYIKILQTFYYNTSLLEMNITQ